MCYANIDDMICRYGRSELLCLADKSQPLEKENALNVGTASYDRVICALEDSCAYLNQKLSCCFDAKQLKIWCDEGKVFPLLKLWQATIARYYLYDIINLSSGGDKPDTEQYRRYKQVLSDIKEFCDPDCCTKIVDESGECCLEKLCKAEFAVASRPKSCIPDVCCDVCGNGKCCCYSSKDEQ